MFANRTPATNAALGTCAVASFSTLLIAGYLFLAIDDQILGSILFFSGGFGLVLLQMQFVYTVYFYQSQSHATHHYEPNLSVPDTLE